MLTLLDVRDFAIVDRVTLELGGGLTVLTGETGAGKSILVEALGLVLGDRASASVVRPGAERAEISAVFDLSGVPELQARLTALELGEEDGACILRRSVGADGRSRAFVNGRPTTLQGLRDLGELLVEVHGQHAHQSLLRRETQRAILDDQAGTGALLEALRDTHRRWQEARQALTTLGGTGAQQAAERELLGYQVAELRAAAPDPRELEALAEEQRRLAHAEALAATAQRGVQTLEDADEGALVSGLEGLARELGEMGRYDPRLLSLRELLAGAAIQAREAAGELRRYADAVEVDPERLQQVEQRIAALETLARKHRVPARELATLLAQLESRVAAWERGDAERAALEAEAGALSARYDELALRLHRERAAAAPALAERIAAGLDGLGMPGGRFAVRVDHAASDAPGPAGRDRVEFLFSANPGQPLAPLSEVASGGELSRVSLAIQVIAAQGRGVPTQIFDEVDSGVGGRVAEIVGLTLRRLAGRCQVLCVTHLPQVAAHGQHHLRVRKESGEAATTARVEPLAPAARVTEVARMLAGVRITDRALAHAREMIERAAADAELGGAG
jgi:DNA repair protein RecN (Recombination protein N)